MPLIEQLLFLLVLAWLPGAILYRIPVGNRDARYRLPAEERLFWQVVVSLALSLAGVMALAWFGRYELRILVALHLALVTAIALVCRSSLRLTTRATRPGLSLALPAILIALGGATCFPPSEYIIAGKDPGTYVGEGVQIAQRGSLIVQDEVIASVPASFRDLFFPSHQREDYYSNRFMGFFIQDPDAGTVIGQFPHVFPAALAVGYGLDGLTGVRRTTPVLGILGVLAVYFAGVHLFGRAAAFAAAVLMLLNVIQIWFARYPNAEVVMQVFLFASILAIMHWQSFEDPWFPALAGLLIGLLLFLRFDVVLALGAVLLALILQAMLGRRFPWQFPLAVAVPAALAVAYLVGPMQAYATYPFGFIRNLAGWQQALLVIAGLALLAALPVAARSQSVRRGIEAGVPVVLAAVCCIAGLYALYLREPGGRLAIHDAYALRTYANFYVTVPAVLAAILAFALFVRGWFWRAPVFYLVVAAFSLFLFYKIRIFPDHFWAARRFLPVIFPSTLLLVAAVAVGGRGFGARWLRAGRLAIGVTFLVLLGGSYLRASAPVRHHVEYEGLIPRLEKLAALFTDDDLVLIESRDAGSDTHVFGMPLAYIYARDVLVLNSASPDKPTLAAFLTWAKTRYANVYFVGAGGTDILSYSYGVEPIASDRFQVPEYESIRNGYPRGPRRKEFEYGVYRFTVAPPRTGDVFNLDVGGGDNLHVLRFHASEKVDGRSFRWTGPQSFVSVTSVPANVHEVVLTAADGGRPPAAGPARITVYLDQQPLGETVVSGRFKDYTFAIPPELAARVAAAAEPVQLRIVTTTWNPATVVGIPDSRQLGVMLDRVTVK